MFAHRGSRLWTVFLFFFIHRAVPDNQKPSRETRVVDAVQEVIGLGCSSLLPVGVVLIALSRGSLISSSPLGTGTTYFIGRLPSSWYGDLLSTRCMGLGTYFLTWSRFLLESMGYAVLVRVSFVFAYWPVLNLGVEGRWPCRLLAVQASSPCTATRPLRRSTAMYSCPTGHELFGL